MSIGKHKRQLRPQTTQCLSLVVDFLESQKAEYKLRSTKDVRFFFQDFFEAAYDRKGMDAGTYCHKSEQLRHSLKRLVERGILSREHPEGDVKRYKHRSNYTLGDLQKIRDNNPKIPKADLVRKTL